jgi:methionine-rich copper-binding protein CopC
MIRALLVAAVLALGGAAAFAHAFLDHAEPAVGRTLERAPSEVRLWFTQKLEPAFSHVQVFDEHDKQVDRSDSHVDAKDPVELVVSLPPLAPGVYKVVWRAVSVDTHVTNGEHTFKVAGP